MTLINKEEKIIEILELLKENSRETLTNLSKKTEVPISTIFDWINKEIKHKWKFTIVSKDQGSEQATQDYMHGKGAIES